MKEIEKLLISLNDEEREISLNGFDKRSYDFLKKLKNQIGLLETFTLDDKLEIDDIEALNLGMMDVFLGKSENNYITYCIIEGVCDNNSYFYTKFNKKPTVNDIEKAEIIHCLELVLKNTLNYKYKCRKCNKELHWLDSYGTLNKKYLCLIEQHCC
ncbi:hypothetical protein P5F33_01740 [Clostridium perfringens]|uniref:hypothetical protein n=1 Tax=Clostridium perfringens TaxID=1502 RepID=UPI001CCBE006|nr:hypothetical protein [Clostridium perfringens]MDU7714700.1 hypothetical protein [Clostridium butyricum]MDU7869997.1 hypothetical protein [Pantoea sp.]ELC8350698.1 hypothetical protein [Clostridium perfringens]MDK0728103.1 hypothetical protein [Clostridium perfringens]MDK0874179.1 hypothetical protein [Clostridium perfringens]